MKNELITEYLNHFFKIEKPQYAILLKGQWGSGKTFFIKNLIKDLEQGIVDENTNIQIKPIYISLNGISKTSTINEKIKAKISPWLYSKGAKIAKNILKGLVKTTIKVDLDLNSEDEGTITYNIDPTLIFENNENISGKKIIVFDDIERCKIPTDEIFGYINDFVEHTNCKIILVAEEDVIKRKYKNHNEYDISYKDFKEKLIGKTFEIEVDISNALEFFIKDIFTEYPHYELIDTYKQLIAEIFNLSGVNNLRVLKQSLLDYKRVSELIDFNIKCHSNFEIFFKDFICYFIITYLEYKTGNIKIKYFQSVSSFFKTEKESNDEDHGLKYKELFSKYSIQHSNKSIQIESLVNYIETGILNGVMNDIKNNDYFRKTEVKDWEALWWWRNLEDEEFKKLKKSVWSDFTNGRINTTPEILHICGLFLTFARENLTSIKAQRLITKAKHLLKSSVVNENILYIEKHSGMFNSSYGKQYQSIDTIEFKEILNFLESLIIENQSSKSKLFLTTLFNLDTFKVDKLYHSLKEYLPDSSSTYEETNIFRFLNCKKFANKLISLDNKSILSFREFLHYRYYPEEKYANLAISNYHILELDFLKELLREISIKHFKNKPLKMKVLNEFKNELQSIIEKIELFRIPSEFRY